MVWLPSYTHRTRSASRVLHDRSLVILYPEKVDIFAGIRQLVAFSMGVTEDNLDASQGCDQTPV